MRTSVPPLEPPLSSKESDSAAISGSPSPSAFGSGWIGWGWMPPPWSRTTIVSPSAPASMSTLSPPPSASG